MDKNTAKKKIVKLLALATNSGATEFEKANAVEMANKLAAKYGLKIVKQKAKSALDEAFEQYEARHSNTSECFTTKLKYFDLELVRCFFKVVKIKCTIDTYAKAVIFDTNAISKTDASKLAELYTNFYKYFKNCLEATKLYADNWSKANTKIYKKAFIIGVLEATFGFAPKNEHVIAYIDGYKIGLTFRKEAK